MDEYDWEDGAETEDVGRARSRLPAELRAAQAELGRQGAEKRNTMEKAKARAAERLDGMADKVIDALEFALESEDEGVRLKAALALMDRLVPKVGVDKGQVEEVVEIIPDSRKRILDDVEAELRKLQERNQPES